MALIDQIQEAERAAATLDRKFVKSLLYYFEMRVPPSVSKGVPGAYLYPLVLPPESFRLSEPFQVERTITNGGGLFVEEQGVTGREITISGTTGWAPLRATKIGSDLESLSFPRFRSFSRTIPLRKAVHLLSGQRHFQFLHDTVFRVYGDLKQDPATSQGTELYLHVVKDDERWRVIPLSFTLSRTAAKPLTYQYDIQLLAVSATRFPEVLFSEDNPVLEALKSPSRVLRSAVTTIRAALADLAGVRQELRETNGGVTLMLEASETAADNTEAFLDGTASRIQQPFSSVGAASATGQQGLGGTSGLSDSVVNTMRTVTDALDQIGSYPAAFRDSIQEVVDRFQKRLDLATAASQEALAAAASRAPPQTLRDWGSLGSSLMPGDAARAQESLGLGRFTPRYTGASEWVIEQGDTLVNLAARFLGDARLWKYIAVFNDLSHPYITETGLPGTRRVGDTILIPNFSSPPAVSANPVTLGVRLEEPAVIHALGRDLRMDPVDRDTYDLVVDVEGGSVDLKAVGGVPNLQQALRTRIITERGTDVLYRNLGAARVVGLGVTEVDLETAQIRLGEAILGDPRVAGLQAIKLELEAPDSVVADVTAEVRGLQRPERVVLAVPA